MDDHHTHAPRRDDPVMTVPERPRWPPYSIYIATYAADSAEETELKNLVEKLFQQYGGVHPKDSDSLDFRSGSASIYARCFVERDSLVLLVAAGPAETEKESLNTIPSYEKYDELVEDVRQNLPKEPGFTYSLRLAYTTNQEEARALLQGYSKREERSIRSGGISRNCLLATLEGPRASPAPMLSRELIVLSYGHETETATDIVWTLCSEVCSLAVYIGEMRRLYTDRKLMIDQMDASEENTQLRINEILAAIRRPVDQIKPADLEGILEETTIQFSRLSTLASSMRRDYIKARSLHREMANLLRSWNLSPLNESPTNSSVEMDDFENLVTPFADFTERTEALITQLNTLLDSVRTYLGIQTTKANLELSSKIAWMTWILVVLTAVLAVFGVVPLIQSFHGIFG